MGVVRQYDKGLYVANEESMYMHAATYGGGGPVVIVIPGVAGTAWGYTPGPPMHPYWWTPLPLMAEMGAVVISGTYAAEGDGGASWGNVHGRNRMDAHLAWAAANLGADLSRIAVLGDSEGGDLGLNWAWRHHEQVKAMVTRLTPPDVQSLYAINIIVEDTVDTAFDDLGGWAANRETHDPGSATNRALIADRLADRMRMYYSTDDGLAPEDQHIDMAADTGCEIRSLGPVMHDIGTTGAVHAESLAGWIMSRLT